MSNDGGAGTSGDGQQGTQAGTGDNGAGAGAGATTATTSTTNSTSTDDWGAADWKALADELGLKPAEVKEKLGHARTWEQRAKDNKGAADQLPTLQQQLDEMKKALAERDVRDTERAGRLAMSQLQAGLAKAGIEPDDVKDVLGELDPTRLLKDGEPNPEAISRIVGGLSKAAGRPTADQDQGKKSGAAPKSMGALMREMAQGRR